MECHTVNISSSDKHANLEETISDDFFQTILGYVCCSNINGEENKLKKQVGFL